MELFQQLNYALLQDLFRISACLAQRAVCSSVYMCTKHTLFYRVWLAGISVAQLRRVGGWTDDRGGILPCAKPNDSP